MKKTYLLLVALVAFAASLTANADPAYYLIGQFNEWNDGTKVPFVLQEDGSFVLTQTFSGEFKVKDENGNWLGGQATNANNQCVLTYDNPSANLVDGANFFIDGGYAEYTLTIADGMLTVTGLPEPAYYLYAEEFSNWQEPLPFTKLKENNDGVPSYTLSRVFKGKFKVVDEYGHWYGGNTPDGSDYWLTSENRRVALSETGSNLYFDGEPAAYTLTIAGGVLVTSKEAKPRTPDESMFDWNDYTPYQWPDGTVTVTSGWFFIDYGQDVMGYLVADDYPGISGDEAIINELTYVKLDPSKFSYSIYTDYEKLFVFDPEVYEEFTEPTTDVFIFNVLNGASSTPTGNFEYWGPHFPNLTNQVEGFDGLEPFFKYRIGIQMHYTVDGVTTSSDIAWYNIADLPALVGDVTGDGKVDVEDLNAVVNIMLGKAQQSDYPGNANIAGEDDKIDVQDMNAIINIMLGKVTE